jgi:ferric-dicitrate binding protein FerR (iron transport regulator)
MSSIDNDMTSLSSLPSMDDRFFMLVETPFNKNHHQSWEMLEARLREPGIRSAVRLPLFRAYWAAAAALLILLGTFTVLRFYTAVTLTENGQHLSCTLPDGTSAELNAGSRISYHPMWWRFSRDIRFEGEGYFKVEKGKQLRVRSANGTTEVLGTSFTIYARKEEYRVTCFTGMIRVKSTTGDEAVLTPDYSASVGSSGNITVVRDDNATSAASWVKGMFSFRSRPLRTVLDEIQRQYDVTIHFDDGQHLFTGYFSKDRPTEEVLELVSRPFGLTFVKKSEGAYEIIKNE